MSLKNEKLKKKWDSLRAKSVKLKKLKSDKSEIEYEVALKDIQLEFDQLFHESNGLDYFHKFCSSRVFISCYEERRTNFFKMYPEADDLEFCNRELKSLRDSIDFGMGLQHSLKIMTDEIYVLLNPRLQENIRMGEANKIDFLLKKSGVKKTNQIGEDSLPNTKSERTNSTKLKVAYLAELGVLEFLKSRYKIQSNRQLARLVIQFTDEIDKEDNFVRTVNEAMGHRDSKNNPRTPENLETIKAKLIQLKIF